MENLAIVTLLLIASTLAEIQGGAIESRLLGSKDSESNSHHYHVALYQTNPLTQKFVGSGALLSDRWLITSAHVAEQVEGGFIYGGKVLAGLTGLDVPPAQSIKVDKIIIHEFYNKSGVADNDIALVKVQKPFFIINEKIIPIDLAEGEPKGQVVVTAWHAAYKEKKPRQELSLDVIDRTKCGEELGKPEYIDETVFCVKNTEERAVCTDDNGSPAITINGDKQYVVGIFAWAEKPEDHLCSTKPAIFTNIAFYHKWIKNNMD